MLFRSSGNVGIGTTNPTNDGAGYTSLTLNGSISSYIDLRSNNGGVGRLQANNSTSLGIANISGASGYIHFDTNSSERLRIDSSGNVGIGTTSSGPRLEVGQTANDWTGLFKNSASTGNVFGIYSAFTGKTPNDTNSMFFNAADTTNSKCTIYATGTISNRTGSFVAYSDIKLKQDIIDAGDQWNDIKNLRVRKFRLKDEVLQNPNQPFFIGLIAQEAEETCPNLVESVADFGMAESIDQDGNKTTKFEQTGTFTKTVKYSILYMKAVKALQEAMLRIESLESKVAALEAV